MKIYSAQTRVPHISPDFGEMWGLTAANLGVFVRVNRTGGNLLIPTSRQKKARYGAPSFVVRTPKPVRDIYKA